MAQSRIEKFREYRKSVINDVSNANFKTTIETSLETTSTESNTLPSELEEVFLRKIIIRRRISTITFLVLLSITLITLVVFGIILFK